MNLPYPHFFEMHRKRGVHETVEGEEREIVERGGGKGFGSMDFFYPSIDSFLMNKEP